MKPTLAQLTRELAKRVVAVDWDDTLVDAKTQQWLPGAEQALQRLLGQFGTVIIHTSRASWPAGRNQIETKLGETVSQAIIGSRVTIEPKPLADVYIDDKAVRFDGWEAALGEVRRLESVALLRAS